MRLTLAVAAALLRNTCRLGHLPDVLQRPDLFVRAGAQEVLPLVQPLDGFDQALADLGKRLHCLVNGDTAVALQPDRGFGGLAENACGNLAGATQAAPARRPWPRLAP